MENQTANFEFLLMEYRKLWKNRVLETGEISNEEILREAIKRELLDENSHPRIRKNRYVKYYLSIKKLTESSIESQSKLQLIKIYNEQMENLSEE